jgi:single-strand DNA-binding protein
MSDNPIVTMRGNLVEDPELRFTQNGIPVCSMRIAVTHWRGKDKADETSFWNVNVWRAQAENCAESLVKGLRIMVIGELKARSYENRDGQTVWVTEIEAEDVAPSMKWARATVERGHSKDGTPPASASTSNTPPPPADDDVPF